MYTLEEHNCNYTKKNHVKQFHNIKTRFEDCKFIFATWYIVGRSCREALLYPVQFSTALDLLTSFGFFEFLKGATEK